MQITYQNEEWIDIPGYGGKYQISNHGRVKSTLFVNNQCVKYREKILSATDNGNGYLIVSLDQNGKRKSAYVHRLVAEAFLENNDEYGVVNHLDHDKHNNRADNLEWCSQYQNVMYSVDRMRKHRTVVMGKTTGERYICGRRGFYEVTVSKKYLGRYKTLEEAINVRDEALRNEALSDM